MGLQFNMSVQDLGYIQATQDITLYPNYTEGCRVFRDTFLAEAQARCPVRTGYLRSTISAHSTASSITCMVGAEYAQYVEYGTSRQSAQPYFEPALQIALATAQPYWDKVESEVIAQQRKLVKRGRELEEQTEKLHKDGVDDIERMDFETFRGATLGAILLGLFIGLMKIILSTLREVFSGEEKYQPDSNHSGWSSMSSFISTF